MFIRTRSLSAIALAALIAFPSLASAATLQPLERWRSYAGVSWDTPQNGQTPTRFSGSVNAPIAGIHFDAKGRAFVSTPRLVSAAAPATLSILDTTVQSGPARLTAFPSLEENAVNTDPAQNLRNVLGFYIDRQNGWLWALDMGFVAGEAESPVGSQKLVVLDLNTGRTLKRIALDGVADRKASFLNDVVVDEKRRVAYISDSARGAHRKTAWALSSLISPPARRDACSTVTLRYRLSRASTWFHTVRRSGKVNPY